MNIERPTCPICNKRPVERAYIKGSTEIYWRNKCQACRRPDRYRLNSRRKQRYKLLEGALICSRCGFVPEHPIQLEIDHIDGNPTNDNPSNLQVLCANCHRLKTLLNGDQLSPGRRQLKILYK